MSNKKQTSKNSFIKSERFEGLEKAAHSLSRSSAEHDQDKDGKSTSSRFSQITENNEETSRTIKVKELKSAPEQWNFYSSLPQQKFEELTKSIAEKGLLHPIVVWEQEDGYMILSGHNRKKAFEMLYSTTGDEKYLSIPCSVKSIGELTEDEAREIIIDTNWIQRELSTLEKARSISEKYIRLGRKKHTGDGVRTRDKLAKQYNISGRMVQNYLSLTTLAPELENMLSQNTLSVKNAVVFSRLDESMQRWLYQSFSTKELSSAEARSINSDMSKKQITELLKKEEELINVSVKIPKLSKKEFLSMVDTWLQQN